MLFRLFLVFALCGSAVYTSSGTLAQVCDSLSLKAAPSFPIGSRPYGMISSDFNRDGNVDIAIGSSEIQSVSLLAGYGSGSLKPTVNFPAGASPRSMATADFNNDTNPDLAVVSGSNILVFTGAGDGSFSVAATLSAGLNQFNLISLGDFNGDSKTDIVVTTLFDPHQIYFFMGTGSGTFGSPTTIPLSLVALSMTVGDFNSDGKSDVVFLFPNIGNINAGIIFGTAGTFSQTLLFDAGDFPSWVVAGDFDNDNKLDLAITDSGGAVGFISILPGNGIGGFGPSRSFDSKVGALTVGDFNGDGRLDLVGFNDARNTVGIWFNSSSGNFFPSPEFFAGGNIRFLQVADFNNDSKSDLAVANVESYDVSILINDGTQRFLASESIYVGSGSPNMLGAGSPSDVISQDINGDGRLDLIAVDYLLARASVLIGNVGGGFNSPIYYRLEHEPIPSISYPGAQAGFVTGVDTVDYDRDGKLDLITANLATNNFTVIFGDGTGVFGLPYNFDGNIAPRAMEKADLNTDGIPDLVVAGSVSNGVGVGIMLGRPQGGFNPVGTAHGVGQQPTVKVADVTNDGKLDIICTAINLDRITVLVGDGLGGVSATNIIPLSVHPVSTTPSDLNGDGRQDLVLVADDPGRILIFLNDGNGLSLVNSFLVPIGPRIATVSDFNGDGKLDIALAALIPKVVRFYAGNGLGSFVLVGSFGSGGDPRGAVAADFNQDGRPDLAVTNYASSTLTVLFSKPCSFPDLSLKKSHSQTFIIGQSGIYTLQVNNTGVESSAGPIRVVDNLPTGLSFSSAVGSGWLCAATGQTVTCDSNNRILAGATDSIVLTVAVSSSAFPSVTNTAMLEFSSDPNTANNSASDPTQVGFTISGTVQNGGSGLAGVTMTLSGDQSATAVTGANGSYTFNVSNGSYTVTPSRNAFLFNPASRSFANVTANQIANFEALPQAPVLLTEENSSIAIALDSSTFRIGPFPALQNNYFIQDARTRVMIFATSLGLQPGDDASNMIAGQAEDSLHRIYNLPVETARPLPGFEWISQVTVKLTDEMANAGDLSISISIHGVTSNKVLLPMRPSFTRLPSALKNGSK